MNGFWELSYDAINRPFLSFGTNEICYYCTIELIFKNYVYLMNFYNCFALLKKASMSLNSFLNSISFQVFTSAGLFYFLGKRILVMPIQHMLLKSRFLVRIYFFVLCNLANPSEEGE